MELFQPMRLHVASPFWGKWVGASNCSPAFFGHFDLRDETITCLDKQ